MRSLKHELRSLTQGRNAVLAQSFVALVMLMAIPGVAATAQTPSESQPAASPQVQASTATATPAKAAPEMTEKEKRQAAIEAQRQKDLAADTAKLLALANELKAEMDKSTKDTLSLAVMRKAEEVEKLARKVRDEMKATIGY